jgi:hypothetical protein
MAKIVLPGQQISIQRPTGEIDAIWYEKLRALIDAVNAGSGGGGGGGPITLTGDVTGTGTGTIATIAIKIQGHAVSTTAPTSGQVLEWTGSAWTPTNLPTPSIAAGPYTVSTLPAGTVGQLAYVTDGAASQTWASTITGGGTHRYLVWFNGAHWTVVGDGGYAPAAYPTYYIYGF